jgi:hypothetical protein
MVDISARLSMMKMITGLGYIILQKTSDIMKSMIARTPILIQQLVVIFTVALVMEQVPLVTTLMK